MNHMLPNQVRGVAEGEHLPSIFRELWNGVISKFIRRVTPGRGILVTEAYGEVVVSLNDETLSRMEGGGSGAFVFVEVISATAIVAGTRWRYYVQPGTWEITATGSSFEACWTLGPEEGRFYTISALEINNTAANLPGGEGSDMTNADGIETERKPIPVGAVRTAFWTGSFYILDANEMVDRSCA